MKKETKMREIKFRGLRTDGKGWVYGSIVYPNRLLKGVWIVPDVNICDFYPDQKDDEFDPNAEHHGITIGRFLEVITETVGQFTGLKDKNGKEIYEGDVLSCPYWYGENYVINYVSDTRWTGYWFPKDGVNDIEIIGNIHTRQDK